jgi:hypothetical protein
VSDSSIGLLLLSGTLTLVCDLLRVPRILVLNASIFTPNARLFETTPDLSGLSTILYGTAVTETQEPSLAGVPSVSIGNLSLPFGSGWRFCLSGQDCSGYVFGEIRGLLTLVPGAGSYSIVAEGPSRGFLCLPEGSMTFPVSLSASFFPTAYFTFIPATPSPTSGPTPTPSPASVEPDRPESATLPTGAIIGIVIAVLVVVALVVGFILWRRGIDSNTADQKPAGHSGGGSAIEESREDLSDELTEEQRD